MISITGFPNSGKSTLINCFVKNKISIVSHKVQTTQESIKGIINIAENQLIFIDTPGIGYTSGDTITIFTDDGDNTFDIGLVVTPGNGSIVDISGNINTNEFNTIPNIIINTQTGTGASLIPIIEFKQTTNRDDTGIRRSTLVGITSVIDCI